MFKCLKFLLKTKQPKKSVEKTIVPDKGETMILPHEILMGRDNSEPLTKEMSYNLFNLLPRVNLVRFEYGKPLYVSSGYRPPSINKSVGGSKNSAHLLCEAVDFKDPNGYFAKWCLNNLHILKKAGLYMEDPRWTPGWVHLMSRAPASKSRVFIPYNPQKVPPKRPDFWDGRYDKSLDG